ncbi:MAG: hypothetical protein JSS34_03545 [Proteobacteria bacterium]|nr:hypothetical protein [Pseudomonadota bacterium]
MTGNFIPTRDVFNLNGFSFNPSLPLPGLHEILKGPSYRTYVKSVTLKEHEDCEEDFSKMDDLLKRVLEFLGKR